MKKKAACVVMAVLALAGCSGSASKGTPGVDAKHRPPAIPSGEQPAAANLAAPLLTPADLGTTWDSVETPEAGIRTPPPFDVGPKAVYELRTNLQTQHWSGSAWVQDQNIVEIATSYGTAAKAQRELNIQLLQGRGNCVRCPLAYHAVAVGGIQVWRFDPTQAGAATQALFAVGPLFIRVSIGAPASAAPGVVSTNNAIRLAVERATSHPTA